MFLVMDSLSVVKYPLIVLRLSGVWQPKDQKPIRKLLYNIWTILNVFAFGLLFSLIEFLNIFFVNSADEIVANLMISSTVFVTVIKAYFVIINRKRMLKLFDLIHELDKNVDFDGIQQTFNPILKFSKLLFKIFGCCYFSCLGILLVDTVFADPAKRFYSSTYSYTYEFTRKPIVYRSVLIFQMLANITSCFMDIGLDTYGIILVYILYGHFDVLATKLSKLGTKGTEQENHSALRGLIAHYTTILELVLPRVDGRLSKMN